MALNVTPFILLLRKQMRGVFYMKTLQQFLGTNKITGLTKSIPLSQRIADENGIPYEFTIKTLSPSDISALQSKCLKPRGSTGEYYVDKTAFDISLVISATTAPNFKLADNIKAIGANTPEDYVQAVLLPGEIQRLSTLIQEFNGYITSMDNLINSAKN